MFGVWLTSFEEWLGACGTATKPDRVVVNPEWLRCQQNGPRDVFSRRRVNSQRPHQIPLWDTPERAKAEIDAFEPENRVAGSERVRRYGGTK